jgi:hypothetical protein
MLAQPQQQPNPTIANASATPHLGNRTRFVRLPLDIERFPALCKTSRPCAVSQVSFIDAKLRNRNAWGIAPIVYFIQARPPLSTIRAQSPATPQHVAGQESRAKSINKADGFL